MSLLPLARRLLPFVVAISALLFAFHGIDLKQIQDTLSQAPLGLLVLTSVVMAIANCTADTLAMYYVFRGFNLRLRFFDLYTIRAATYTLAVINYHAGQLGIIGFLHRHAKVSLSRASAYILFIMGVWVALLMIFSTGGAFVGGTKGRALIPVLVLFAIGLVVYGFLLKYPPRFLREAPPAPSPHEPLLLRLWRRLFQIATKLWAPLHEAGISGHLRALFVRLPHLFVLLVWHFIALRCFRVEVPVHIAMLYLPVVFAVAALPISVQGLGTAQVVAKYFFSDYAVGGEAAVVAYSLSMTAIGTVSNLAMGLLFLRRGARLGLEDAADSAARELEAGDSEAGDSEDRDPRHEPPTSIPPAGGPSSATSGSGGPPGTPTATAAPAGDQALAML